MPDFRLDFSVVMGGDLARALAHQLVSVLDHGIDDFDRELALSLSVELAGALAYLDSDSGAVLAAFNASRALAVLLEEDVPVDLVDALALARRVAHFVERVPARITDEGRLPSEVVVRRSARKLAAMSARLLPPVQRERYAEEFSGELRDLAEAGAGRRGQLRYALRLLVRAPVLRGEFKTARRRSASP